LTRIHDPARAAIAKVEVDLAIVLAIPADAGIQLAKYHVGATITIYVAGTDRQSLLAAKPHPTVYNKQAILARNGRINCQLYWRAIAQN
jgi:hypothetical protein